MTTIERELVYRIRALENITDTYREIASGIELTTQTTREYEIEQTEALKITEEVTRSAVKQETQFMQNMTVLSAMKSSVSSLTRGLTTMGIVTGENAEKVRKLNAAFQMMMGVAQMFKMITLASNALRTSQIGLAIVEAFRAAMQNPWKAALVGLGVGAATGVAAGYFMGSNTTHNTNNQIIIENSPSNVQTGVSMYAEIGGGSL